MSAALLVAALTAAPFSVHVTGQGPDVLLVPGLACSAEVWNETVAHLAKAHRVHAFTLAGFAGQPRIPAPMLATIREALARYIADNKLRKPIVIIARYEAQLAAAPKHRVVLATGARHFVMMDDAPFFLAQVDAFLAEAR
jgi:pimeloyl-ACP methyl ester carboxylesterase